MDQTSLGIVVAFIALSMVSTVFVFRYQARRRAVELELAERVAMGLGLRLLDRDEAFRRAYELSGEPGIAAQLERLPAPMLRFLRQNAPIVMEGEKGGIHVSVFEDSRGTSKNRQLYTVVRANFREPLPFALEVSREGAFTKLGKALFQLADLEIGDPDIDPRVRIKTADPEAARARLSRPELRRSLATALGLAPDLRMTSSWVEWARAGAIREEAFVAPVLEALIPVARSIGLQDPAG